MKKVLLSAMLVCCAFLVSGCGANWAKARTEKDQLKEEREQTVLMGRIAGSLAEISREICDLNDRMEMDPSVTESQKKKSRSEWSCMARI